MTKKKHTTHGIATTDVKVPPLYKKATTDSGWKLQTIKRQHWTSTDTSIAEIYGKGKSILVSNDKTAHEHNTDNGFLGYVYLDGTVSVDEEEQ